MGFKKASGRGRLDKYYHLAKEKGYRARAAFKLIQLNKKYHVLEKSHALLDLCAAPGSWCQVASEVMPPNSLIVGVDLAPIKPIPRCITFQSDITTDKCRATIRQHFKTLKADTVLHDGAPNVGTAWVQDAFSQAELVLQSLRLATEFLAPGGTFITKIFRSKDYNSLLWVFNQLFAKVEATKPPSSRGVSAEIFVVCREYKAPKRLDPRFLDPKAVFADLAAPTPNNEAKVFQPEKKKRKREGYEEGDYTQFKEAPVSEFIQTTDPIAMLGSLNRLSFEQNPNGDLALATLDRLPETTQEVRNCCADLKVLGRSDFKLLLRWRLKVRAKFGMSQKTEAKNEAKAGEEVAEIEPMDEEMRLQEDMQRIKDQADSKKKKERRKENERKHKQLLRMQMNMTTPTDIGMEQSGPQGEESMFALKSVDRTGASNKFASGKMHTITPKAEEEQEYEKENGEDRSDDDEEEDNLESQLDEMYVEYQEKRMEKDSKYKAKKARKEYDDDFEGFSDREASSDEEVVENDDDSDDSSIDEDSENPLFHKPGENAQNSQGLSQRAASFFDQDIFKDIDGLEGLEHGDSGIDMDENEVDSEDDQDDEEDASQSQNLDYDSDSSNDTPKSKLEIRTKNASKTDTPADTDATGTFEVVKRSSPSDSKTTFQDDTSPEPVTKSGRPDIDIITAEAMTLAHAIATGKQTRASLADDSFNKYTLRDTDGLPDWFLDDENQHSKLQKPISAAAAAAIKEKLRALNARPIKKVREAKARKKFRAAQRLEKLKKKSALLVEDTDMSERDKAAAVAKLMSKAAKKKPKQSVKLVVAKGGNRGISGRPRGTKGRYKMVDARMKKEKRAEKRIAKKAKK